MKSFFGHCVSRWSFLLVWSVLTIKLHLFFPFSNRVRKSFSPNFTQGLILTRYSLKCGSFCTLPEFNFSARGWPSFQRTWLELLKILQDAFWQFTVSWIRWLSFHKIAINTLNEHLCFFWTVVCDAIAQKIVPTFLPNFLFGLLLVGYPDVPLGVDG